MLRWLRRLLCHLSIRRWLAPPRCKFEKSINKLFFLKQLKHILCTIRNEHCRLFVFADSLWAKAAPPIATIHRVLSIYCYSFTSDFLVIITQIGLSHEVIGNWVVRTFRVWSFVASKFSSAQRIQKAMHSISRQTLNHLCWNVRHSILYFWSSLVLLSERWYPNIGIWFKVSQFISSAPWRSREKKQANFLLGQAQTRDWVVCFVFIQRNVSTKLNERVNT